MRSRPYRTVSIMVFFTSASFFIVLAALVVPAAILGLAERPLRGYGFAASCTMLAFLFASDRAAACSFLLFVVLSCAGVFLTLGSWKRGARSMAVYGASLALTCAPLVVYKLSAASGVGLLGFIGISYCTFRSVQVIIEIRDGLIDELTLVDYLYFLTFFAQITSGPIDRSRRFIEDAHHAYQRDEYADLLTRGIVLLLVGAVFQLVIATIVRDWYDPVAAVGIGGIPKLANLGLTGVAYQVAYAYGYGIYLFFDFAGYSLMAMGASYCFGIRCPRNFRAPFAAVDIKDFWNRWHITLSTWLRDFVFMRFTRVVTRRHVFSTRLQTACAAYMVNMLFMGAWHGLTPSYLAYGAYHGILLAVTEVYQKKSRFHKRNKKKTWYKALSWAVTMQLVFLGFALFSGQVQQIIEGMM